MRTFAVLLLAVLAAPAFGQPAASWRPSKEQVEVLEARLKLPQGAAPLASYARFYAGVPPRGSDRIAGVLLHQDIARPAGVRLVDKPGDLPVVDDGGCGVIHLTYDLAADEVLDIRCNGVG